MVNFSDVSTIISIFIANNDTSLTINTKHSSFQINHHTCIFSYLLDHIPKVHVNFEPSSQTWLAVVRFNLFIYKNKSSLKIAIFSIMDLSTSICLTDCAIVANVPIVLYALEIFIC
jgi:hypothetical protein